MIERSVLRLAAEVVPSPRDSGRPDGAAPADVEHAPPRGTNPASAGRSEAAGQVRKRQFAALLEHSPQAILILDADGRVREWNPAAVALLGWEREEMLGGLPHRLIPNDARADFGRVWEGLRAGGEPCQLRSERLHRDGSRVLLDTFVVPIKNAGGSFAGALERLVPPSDAAATAMVRPTSAIELDDLTGLPARRWLQRRLAAPLPTGHGRAVAVIDVDAFALVNQGYGPEAGDDVLRILASRLAGAAPGAVLGRWQADEFVCILDSTDAASDLDDLVEQILLDVATPFLVGGDEIRMTVSAGLATSDDIPLSMLFRSASIAMAAAKSRGRDRAVWFDAADAVPTEGGGLRLANDLQRGIAAGELRLHFQPILELATNDVVGVEALVRWERPGVGLLAPGAFIEVAERTGQIVALGEWVVTRACQAAAVLAALELGPLRVSINVSARQLSDPGLVRMLRTVLTETNCDPRNLVIEVTETAVLHDIGAAAMVLEDIKALGVELDLDDFGTGYSSLLYLKHFPVDRIKIDMSFVAGLGTDVADTAIVASTIALAHSIGLTAIAEGVETPEQLNLLRQMGCDFAQGYLLSRPLPQDRLHQWLEQHIPTRLLLEAPQDQTAADDVAALSRGRIADRRDTLGDRRDVAADEREDAGDRRDAAGHRRDHAGDARDVDADLRDRAGDARDRAGDSRDDTADHRDQLADERDRTADRRDDDAALFLRQAVSSALPVDPAVIQEVLELSAADRQEAAADRSMASQDRGVGADERLQAERDRDAALTDRGASADERANATGDRKRARAERRASARDRRAASREALTDLRQPGDPDAPTVNTDDG